MIRVSIITPVMAVRAGLRALLGDDPSIRVVAEGTSLSDLEESKVEVDVVVWSPASYTDAQAALLELDQLEMRELPAILLVHNDAKVLERLSHLPVRAWGGLDPEAGQDELEAAIHAVDEGLLVASPLWFTQIMKIGSGGSDDSWGLVEPLTERELEVLQLLAYGLTNKQIATRLKISAHTVKFHVSSIFTKLGTTNRVETVNLGLKKGLIVL